MVDYVKAIGSTGQMLLRDNGTNAEFWLMAGPQTYCNNKPWGYTANGGTNHSLLYSYSQSGNWQHIGTVGISGSQNVNFWIGASGTNGLDGPADITGYFQRATVPGAPYNLYVTNIWSTTSTTVFWGDGDGGAVIDQWQHALSTNPSGGMWYRGSNGTDNLTGLTPGTTYYFWAQGHNAMGWGPWAGPVGWTTLRWPDPPSAVVISDITQTSVKASWSDGWHGGTGIDQRKLGYGLVGQGAAIEIVGNPPITVTGLIPGTEYEFFAISHNAIGWGGWTGATRAKTIAGGLIKVGTEFKDAVPYVRVGGVWKLARPWSNQAGTWKESQ